MIKPNLLIISAVYPFPRHSGQQQRVFYKLKALRNDFYLTFLTVSPKEKVGEVYTTLQEYCDDVIVLPSRYTQNKLIQHCHRVAGLIFQLFTGLKFSNYLIGNLEFPYKRIKPFLTEKQYDGVLFEYWHAHKTSRKLKRQNIPTILDMHDILWQSYTRQWATKKWAPDFFKKWFTNRYRKREESSWKDFDILIAINQSELAYTQKMVGENANLLYAPMGTDISAWPYNWKPKQNPRSVAYYGGLGSIHNQQDALMCYQEIMPLLWEKYPQIEYWIVGSNPPQKIKDLESTGKVHVTGYVEHVQDVLKSMSLVLCPWSGTYGFRSRVVEVMSLGVPVVASHDAIYGMGFDLDKGICVGDNPEELAQLALYWLSQEETLKHQSLLARQQIEEKFSFQATYGEFTRDLFELLSKNSQPGRDG